MSAKKLISLSKPSSLSELIEGKVSLSQLRDVSLSDLLGRKEISLDETLINRLIKGKRVLVTGSWR